MAEWIEWSGEGEPENLHEIDVVGVILDGGEEEEIIRGSKGLLWDWAECDMCDLTRIKKYRIRSYETEREFLRDRDGEIVPPTMMTDEDYVDLKEEMATSHKKEMVVRPNHYMQFNVEVDKICQWILNHKENAHLDKWEAAKMCDELEYRLRAGFKTGCFEEDMKKAMNINKNRVEYSHNKKTP